jgi:hypothetical protein
MRSPGHGLTTGPVMTTEERERGVLHPHRITPPSVAGQEFAYRPRSGPRRIRQPVNGRGHGRVRENQPKHGRAGGKQRLQPVNGPRGEERRSRDRDWTVSRTCSRKPITASLPSPLWGGAGGGGQTKQSARPLHPTAKTSLWQSGRFSAIRWPERWPWPVFFHGLCWTASRHQASSSSSFERSAYDVDYT